ncbi:L-rhamnose mutarotase [Vibrio crassostreae]|uniref:L-rhamnose mutarotase n=1 Tax=Vibrio crassostreae TaxID=246167 RepID=UPI000F46B49B|nr:L-rhamnose mutarotase [Vibrio crassostreae]NOH75716.1 L-rhamnose mutarotase [Vibrio crassostreae]ROR13036.1 L-rhamnose mutarotase [Vibrio crassostreae]TCN75791.1 L-rhamnose mutarotase [Vibrio crassostreae]TWD72117.1 L-rhamnose mutarotase [Vibrio crassostreae]CAK2175730.1 L-rhamnose mutarotase [Vibrio crassostreae]
MNNLIRKAFVMQLNEGCKAEYSKRHDEIWPELVDVLKSHSAHNYSIFFHEATNQLFGYVEIESEELWQQVAHTETCQKWWSYMQDIMATNPDKSPQSIPIEPVFYLA